MTEFTGVGVSPGRAVARLVHMPAPVAEPAPDHRLAPDADVKVEQERIATAATRVRDDLEARAQRAQGDGKAVLEATAMMAADPTLVAAAQGKVAEGARPEIGRASCRERV